MGNPSIKQKSCSFWRGWTNRQIILCMQMHTDMYIYTLVHSLMYVFTYCTYFFCVFNGWCLSLPLSVSLSLSVYTYIHIYILILYTYYVRFVRSAIWGPFILRPICIGRCLPQGYSQWGAEFFTSTEIHGFPVDPLQSSRSQVHATGVAVSEGLAEKGWVGRCLHLVI